MKDRVKEALDILSDYAWNDHEGLPIKEVYEEVKIIAEALGEPDYIPESMLGILKMLGKGLGLS